MSDMAVLIVTQQREFSRVVRASLELIKDDMLIVDDPSGEEALLELGRYKFDVIIADYFLPGMTGADFLKKALKRNPEAKGLITTDQDINVVHRHAEEAGAVKVIIKPIQQHAFSDLMHELLGLAAQGIDEDTDAAEDELGRIPTVDDVAVSALLTPLLSELNASALFFVNRAGEVLLRTGHEEASLRFGELVVLLARNLTTTAAISAYLGDAYSPAVHYYDGDRHSLYALSVGEHFFIAIVYSGGAKNTMGPVMRYVKPVAVQLAGLIEAKKLTVAAPAKPVTGPLKPLTPAPAAEPETAAPASPAAQKLIPTPEPQPETETEIDALVAEGLREAFGLNDEITFEAEPAETLDLDAVFVEAGPAASNELPDLDSFWEEAAEEAGKVNEESLSLEEALKMGLIDGLDA